MFVTKQPDKDSTVIKSKAKAGASLAPPAYGLSFIDNAPLQKKDNKTGMPDTLKSGVESLSGIDMSDVKVHYNSSQPAQLNALAYAQGATIHIAPGQEKHLPHEAWHVVQQKQGRVRPTLQLKGNVTINTDTGLEHDADRMGAKALQRNADRKKKANGSPLSISMNPVQMYRGKNNNKQQKQSQKANNKFQQAQKAKQHTVVPKKTRRGREREEDRRMRQQANHYGGNNKSLNWYHYVMIAMLLSSMMIPSASASTVGRSKSTMRRPGFDDYTDPLEGLVDHGSAYPRPSMSPPMTGISNTLRNTTSGMSTSLVPVSTVRSENITTPSSLYFPQPMTEVPQPSQLHLKNVKLHGVKDIGTEAGASKGQVADRVDFAYGGKKWDKAYLKGPNTNYNTDNSTVRASLYNSKFLRSMGVTIPEIESVHDQATGNQYIASRDVGGYKHYKKLNDESHSGVSLNAGQRKDYVKLALLSPVADLHEKNFGLIGDAKKMGTIDVDTALPMHSHNYRRLIDRFKLDPAGYKTNDMSGSYTGAGTIQDYVRYHEIEIKEADVVNAVKDFCAVPLTTLAAQLEDYPLQGKAVQKLTLHSLLTQQRMLKEAFKDFHYKPSEETAWVHSTGYQLLEKTIEKYERENQFPYSFKVADSNNLRITVNEKFQRKRGTGFWNDASGSVTNPQLVNVVKSGHLGDANLRLTDKTNISPNDIPMLIGAAKPYLRSIGAGNPGVSFIVRLIHHPSFSKMSPASKGNVKAIFANVASGAEASNPFRQALFPKSENNGKFKVDSFYEGSSDDLRAAVEKLKKL